VVNLIKYLKKKTNILKQTNIRYTLPFNVFCIYCFFEILQVVVQINDAELILPKKTGSIKMTNH